MSEGNVREQGAGHLLAALDVFEARMDRNREAPSLAGFEHLAIDMLATIRALAAQPAPDLAGLLDRAPEIAKALFKEVPTCTGCDFDHGWDDHVRTVFRDVMAARSTEEDRT